jgi:hypothetical protein
MKIEELEKKFRMAARAIPPSDQVPYAFEKRIMSRLVKDCATDFWSVWGQLLWKAATPFLAIMLFMSLWSAFELENKRDSETLAIDLERVVMSPVAQAEESW